MLAYGLVEITPPTVEPVSRTALKEHLRLDTASDDLDVQQSIVPGDHVVAAAYSLEGASVDLDGYSGTVFLNAGACGASGTVAVKLQDSPDNAEWTDVASGAFTTVTEANDNAVQEKAYTGTERYIRVVATVAVATCDFSVDVARQALTTEENDLLDALEKAARRWCENYCRRSFVNTTWTLTLDSWPGTILLPRNPVSAVGANTVVKYYDTAGSQQTLAAAAYTLDTTSIVARLVPAYGYSWPSTQGRIAALEVAFVAGYGAAATAVPDAIRTAIKMLAAHWYENREAVSVGNLKEVPMAVESLLAPYRIVEAI